MTRKISGAIFVFALLLLAGCKQDKDHTTLAPYLYDYAPVNVGHSVTYDVDSVEYNYIQGDTQFVDTFHYQIKEAITDTFYDLNGVVNYRIAVYKRTDTTQPFSTSSYQVWRAFFSRGSNYQTVENDLQFVKLVFPPIMGETWQGNEYLPANDTVADTYQPYAGWTYTYTAVNMPSTINNQKFDSTLTVTQINSQNLINDAVSIETYARHVGLIYKQFEVITKQDVTSGWDYPNQANGFRIKMRIHSYTP